MMAPLLFHILWPNFPCLTLCVWFHNLNVLTVTASLHVSKITFFVTYHVFLPKALPDVKVLDVDILVGRSLPLAPQQEAFFGGCLCGRGEGIIVKLEKLSGFYFDRLSANPCLVVD